MLKWNLDNNSLNKHFLNEIPNMECLVNTFTAARER